MPLIRETNGNAVALTGPKFLDQPIVQFLCPFANEELLNRFSPGQELRSVSPYAVGRIGQRHSAWITRIPSVLCHPHLLSRGLGRKLRKRRTGLRVSGHVAFSRSSSERLTLPVQRQHGSAVRCDRLSGVIGRLATEYNMGGFLRRNELNAFISQGAHVNPLEQSL